MLACRLTLSIAADHLRAQQRAHTHAEALAVTNNLRQVEVLAFQNGIAARAQNSIYLDYLLPVPPHRPLLVGVSGTITANAATDLQNTTEGFEEVLA